MRIQWTPPRDAAHTIIAVRFCPPSSYTRWPPVEQWDDDLWTHWLSQHDGWDHARIQQYLDHDRYEYGFGLKPDGELADHVTAHEPGVSWLYRPTPIGVSLHACPTPNLLWGGSAGGSKSFSARWELIRTAWRITGYRAICSRRELEQLRRTHLDKIDAEASRICKALGNDKAIKVTMMPAVATFTTRDAKIIFAHAQHDGDEEKYLSEDYDDYLSDEATRMLPKQIIGIAGRLRNDTKTGRRARMFLTTNPGGPAHDYCVSRFITHDVPHAEDPKYDPADYTFIRARLYDNPFYMDPDGTYTSYEKRLSAYAPARRRQLLDGDWTSVVGQFFEHFDAERHVHTTT